MFDSDNIFTRLTLQEPLAFQTYLVFARINLWIHKQNIPSFDNNSKGSFYLALPEHPEPDVVPSPP